MENCLSRSFSIRCKEQRNCHSCRATVCVGEFKTVASLQNCGLQIYVHKETEPPPKQNSQTKKKENAFILHNDNDKALERPDFIKELCQYRTKCMFCKAIALQNIHFTTSTTSTKYNFVQYNFVQQVRSLLDKVIEIKSDQVIGVCEYCKGINPFRKCRRCEYLVDKFRTCCNTKQVGKQQDKQELFKLWLKKVYELINKILEYENVNRCTLGAECILGELNKLLKELPQPNTNLLPKTESKQIVILDFLIQNKELLEKLLNKLKCLKECSLDCQKFISDIEDEKEKIEGEEKKQVLEIVIKNVEPNVDVKKTITEKKKHDLKALTMKINKENTARKETKNITNKAGKGLDRNVPRVFIPKVSDVPVSKSPDVPIFKTSDEFIPKALDVFNDKGEGAKDISLRKQIQQKENENVHSEQLLAKTIENNKNRKNKDRLKGVNNITMIPSDSPFVLTRDQFRLLSKPILKENKDDRKQLLANLIENNETRKNQNKLKDNTSVFSFIKCKNSTEEPMEMIKGTAIVPLHEAYDYKKIQKTQVGKEVPLLYRVTAACRDEGKVTTTPFNTEIKDLDLEKRGIIQYKLSDRTFINKGWTVLPTIVFMKRMNVYRMKPACPQSNWFEFNKTKRKMFYESGEILAEIDDNGHGRWFYKNGAVALDFYNAKELNAGKRCVIYSSGEDIDVGKTAPRTVLGLFDYIGNGVVYDIRGKERLKYNQSEGILYDRKIGPPSIWQWHSLNHPPAIKVVFKDTRVNNPDPDVQKLIEKNENHTVKKDNYDDQRRVIELKNNITDKSTFLPKKYVPHKIKVKALKINDNFSLSILEQGKIYLLFRDGPLCLKLNLGMHLIDTEVIDTEMAEFDDVAMAFDRYPTCTDRLERAQELLRNARVVDKNRAARNVGLFKVPKSKII